MFLVVGIAIAGSGLYDLKRIFEKLPTETNMAFIVVAPLLRDRKSMLTEIIYNFGKRPVHKVTEKIALQANHIYVIAENTILVCQSNYLIPKKIPHHPLSNSSIDTLFSSLAINLKNGVIGVILGGMGSAAIDGSHTIEKNGGHVITSEPEDNRNGEMPAAVIKYDTPDKVLPVEQIADYLIALDQEFQGGQFHA